MPKPERFPYPRPQEHVQTGCITCYLGYVYIDRRRFVYEEVQCSRVAPPASNYGVSANTRRFRPRHPRVEVGYGAVTDPSRTGQSRMVVEPVTGRA